MIWYLVICGLDPVKAACTFSPPFKSREQCQFVSRQLSDTWSKRCIGVRP